MWNRIPTLVKRGWTITLLAEESEIQEVIRRYGGEIAGVTSIPVREDSAGAIRRMCTALRKIRSVNHERLVCDLQGLRLALIARGLGITRVPGTLVLLSPPVSTRFRLLNKAIFSTELLCAGALKFGCAVLSEDVASDVRRLSLNTLSPVVTPPGVDGNHFSPGADSADRSYMGVPDEAFLLLYHGVLDRTRRLDLLLRGLRLLFKERPDLHLAIVGSGNDESRLLSLVEDLRIDGQVHFLGQIPYMDLPRYIRAADVAVIPLPNDQSWSTPYKMLEAMACGKPVIASDVPAIREIAIKSGCVRFAPNSLDGWSDAVLELMQSPDERARMAMRGRRYVMSNHSWEHSVDMLEKVLDMSTISVP